jgi:8-hydroxy-5-deazaflavin:NADPH oxidoreductase
VTGTIDSIEGADMKITVIGRGRVGGGLADRWERAGHTVTRLGRDGGAALDADAVLVAVPSGQIAAALDGVSGLEGKVAIDATNAFDGRDEAYQSLAHEVKAIVGGPVAKAFNLQHAALYDRIDEQPVRPSNIYVAEDGARAAAEALSRDAGYGPVFAGGLEQARVLEDAVELFGAIRRAGGGPYFHRFAKPGELAAPVLRLERTTERDRRNCFEPRNSWCKALPLPFLLHCARAHVVDRARRRARRCFAITADLIDPGRVNILERWESQAAVEAFRRGGPSTKQGAAMLSASVAEYDIADVRPLSREGRAWTCRTDRATTDSEGETDGKDRPEPEHGARRVMQSPGPADVPFKYRGWAVDFADGPEGARFN